MKKYIVESEKVHLYGFGETTEQLAQYVYNEMDISIARTYKKQKKITSDVELVNFLRDEIIGNKINVQECFLIVYLNRRNEIISVWKQTVGTSTSTQIDLKLLVRVGLDVLAESVIVAHNHPSGETKASEADKTFTENLKKALSLVNISLLDSMIITQDDFSQIGDLPGIGEFNYQKNTTMITKENYYEKVLPVLKDLPTLMQEMHDLINELTDNGKNWNEYDGDAEIRQNVDIQFQKLQEWFDKNKQDNEKDNADKPKPEPAKKKTGTKKPKQKREPKELADSSMVTKVTWPVRIARRFASMNGKKFNKSDIGRMIKFIQKPMLTGEIRKADQNSDVVMEIQKFLVEVYNNMNGSVEINIDEKRLEFFKNLGTSEKVFLAVNFIKRFVSMYNSITKDKAKKLKADIEKALTAGKIPQTCPYYSELETVYESLSKYLDGKDLYITQQDLRGLQGICNCSNLKKKSEGLGNPFVTSIVSNLVAAGITESIKKIKPVKPENSSVAGVMSSSNLHNMSFQTIGLDGKYKELIGDPEKGFSCIIFGMPKKGKSTFAIKFAKYLAEKIGKVLFVAIEERFGLTLKDKFERMQAFHPRLFISDKLLDDYSVYDFVFIDSVSKAGLSNDDLEILKDNNPNTAFIFIMQTTKAGKFRGDQTFAHDQDIIIEVEDGVAKASGRFAPPSEMQIFNISGNGQ